VDLVEHVDRGPECSDDTDHGERDLYGVPASSRHRRLDEDAEHGHAQHDQDR